MVLSTLNYTAFVVTLAIPNCAFAALLARVPHKDGAPNLQYSRRLPYRPERGFPRPQCVDRLQLNLVAEKRQTQKIQVRLGSLDDPEGDLVLRACQLCCDFVAIVCECDLAQALTHPQDTYCPMERMPVVSSHLSWVSFLEKLR